MCVHPLQKPYRVRRKIHPEEVVVLLPNGALQFCQDDQIMYWTIWASTYTRQKRFNYMNRKPGQ